MVADGGNGWWYGHTLAEADSVGRQSPTCGYFPSNYVTITQSSLPVETEEIEEEDEHAEQDLQMYDTGDMDYADFAKKLVSKEQVR